MPIIAIIGGTIKINHRIPRLVNSSLKNLVSRKKAIKSNNNPTIEKIAELRTIPVPFIATIP